MLSSHFIAGIAVNFLVPLLGLMMFLWLCRRMKRKAVQSPPILAFFVLFATCGGWLIVLLTDLFWKWSGMASLGVFYLTLIAPFVTAGFALSLRKRRRLSPYHQTAYIASISSSAVTILVDVIYAGLIINALSKGH